MEEAQKQVEIRKQEVLGGKGNEGEFEIVWCVFDTENLNNNPTFNQAVQVADANNYSLAISNPAFEFWYILHFESTTRPFNNGKEVKGYLKKFINNYKESMTVLPLLVGSMSAAISRAENVLQNHPDGGNRFPNPSTGVHILTAQLIDMSPSGSVHF